MYGATGRLVVKLNAKGRALLRAKRTIRCDLSVLRGNVTVKKGSQLTLKSIEGGARA
jgi:hypothetical protein